MASKTFIELIDKCKKIHNKKSYDYASNNNPHSNFEFASEFAHNFMSAPDHTYATIIGIKIARLIELLNGKEPKNESVEDTFIDLANYVLLWGAYVKDTNSRTDKTSGGGNPI